MTESVMNRHKQTDVIVSPPDEIHPLLGRGLELRLARDFAPSNDTIRRMLLRLRKRLGWSQSFTAATLGVTKSAVVKWESGNRKPTGTAAKLIFLLHSHLVDKSKKVKNAWDLAFWGRIPCRDSIGQAILLGRAIEMNGTYRVPENVFSSMMGTESVSPVEKTPTPTAQSPGEGLAG